MNLTLVEAADAFAARLHEGQLYGDQPYIVHPREVERELVKFGVEDPVTRAAGLCHDLKEDCAADEDVFRSEFASYLVSDVDRMFAMVDACTQGEGANRKARHDRWYVLIPNTPGSVLVKVSDRICNVRNARDNGLSILGMYRKEHSRFRQLREHCRGDQIADKMWDYLEALFL